MKAHYYEISTGNIVLIQDVHDPAAAEAAGYGDPAEYGVLFCDDKNTMEYINGYWVAKLSLEELRAIKLAEIKSDYEKERDVKNKGMFSHTVGEEIDCRKIDHENIMGIVRLYDATGIAPKFYKTKDNRKAPADGEVFRKVLNELSLHLLTMWGRKDELNEKVMAAETEEEINAIKWSW